MEDINKVALTGRLTRDPEVKATASGTSVLSFGLAFNGSKRDASGAWVDVPNFIDCVMFGARAEALGRYLRKGHKIAVGGKLRFSSWEKDGQKRSKIELNLDDVVMMDGNKTAQQQQPAQQAAGDYGYYDDEMPF